MGELWLVRHGETAWSLTGQHTGRTDIPLTADGEVQARGLAERLSRPFTAVLTSPLQRAARTAELIGFSPDLDDRLMEWDYGHAEGRTTRELADERGSWSVWTDPDLPELVDDVGRRSAAVLSDIEQLLTQGDVCLVGHGHALRILAAVWLGLAPSDGRRFAISPASISVLGHEHDRPVLRTWNS